jgi:hypothetical protein
MKPTTSSTYTRLETLNKRKEYVMSKLKAGTGTNQDYNELIWLEDEIREEKKEKPSSTDELVARIKKLERKVRALEKEVESVKSKAFIHSYYEH